MTARHWLAPLLIVGGGVLLLVAMFCPWLIAERGFDVGGVMHTEPFTTPGSQFSTLAPLAAMAAIALGGLVAVLRTTPRRVVAALTVGLGLSAILGTIEGFLGTAGETGTYTVAPLGALAAAVAICAGGAIGVIWSRPSRTPVQGRFQVPAEQTTDDEWEIASGEPE